VGGRAKIIGSAQRVTGTGALFSSVVQVTVPDAVREVIVATSAALGYRLRESSIAGLADVAPALTPAHVAEAFADDYRRRLATSDTQHDPRLLDHTAGAAAAVPQELPFGVDAWCRAHPFRPGERPTGAARARADKFSP
jgi:octanoyl-[GcvH]:protein N-octanoyltransferase